MKKSQSHKKIVFYETLVTLIHDNLCNLILVVIATKFFGFKLKSTLSLWAIGQTLNFLFSYSRRLFFQRFYML